MDPSPRASATSFPKGRARRMPLALSYPDSLTSLDNLIFAPGDLMN